MQQRPRIKIPLNEMDRFLEFSGWAILVIMWGFVLYKYSSLPETIPTHFNASGHPDGFGDSVTIFLLPALATVFFVGLTILNKYPHAFNYPNEVTLENAMVLYKRATSLIRYLKLGLVLLFGFITYKTIRISSGSEKNLGSWLLPMILFFSFSFVVYSILTFTKKVPPGKNKSY